MTKNIKNFLSLFVVCIFIALFFAKFIASQNIESDDIYVYNLETLKKNSLGLFNKNNTIKIQNAKNKKVEKKIEQILLDYKNNKYIEFEGEYRAYIENILVESNSLFFGDSNVQHFEFYDLLNKKLFVEHHGYSVKKQIEFINDELLKNLKNIIIFNGYNLDDFYDADEYISAYEELIKKIKNINSEINIYICSLLPATKEMIEQDLISPLPKHIYMGKEFDIALETHDFQDAIYIDTKWIVKNNMHKADGVHMLEPFYNILVPYVAYFINLDNENIDVDIDDKIIKKYLKIIN